MITCLCCRLHWQDREIADLQHQLTAEQRQRVTTHQSSTIASSTARLLSTSPRSTRPAVAASPEPASESLLGSDRLGGTRGDDRDGATPHVLHAPAATPLPKQQPGSSDAVLPKVAAELGSSRVESSPRRLRTQHDHEAQAHDGSSVADFHHHRGMIRPVSPPAYSGDDNTRDAFTGTLLPSGASPHGADSMHRGVPATTSPRVFVPPPPPPPAFVAPSVVPSRVVHHRQPPVDAAPPPPPPAWPTLAATPVVGQSPPARPVSPLTRAGAAVRHGGLDFDSPAATQVTDALMQRRQLLAHLTAHVHQSSARGANSRAARRGPRYT